jgi:cell division protein FtsW
MGKSTYMNTAQSATNPIRNLRPLNLRIDTTLLLIVAALLVIGFFFVFSASWQFTSYNNLQSTALLLKKLLSAAIGAAIAVCISRFDYHVFQKWVGWIVLVALIALILVLAIGDERNGATRTLLDGRFQPSEVSKLVVILYLAFWLNSKKEVLNQFSLGLFPLITVLGFFMGLILLQPDISAVATIFFIGAMLFFLAGGEIRQIVLVLVAALAIGAVVVSFQSTGQLRISDWINGLQDPEKSSNHVLRSIEAIVRGGFLGVGLGLSQTKFTGLPVPWTDSIFAVITEETGLIGAISVIGLYMALLWRGLKIARNAPDLLGRLLASGVTFWILLEAVINMGQMVNLVPFAGNALPLISAGGSNMVAILAGIGVLMSVARVSQTEPAQGEGRNFSAVIDLRGGDRRRRVSRPGRSASNPNEA